MQSTYRRHHETAIALRVVSDIPGSTDEGKVTLLGLLDSVNAAFNTGNLTILHARIRVALRMELMPWFGSPFAE